MSEGSKREQASFERQAARGAPGGTAGEIWFFLRRTRKWWMLPILLALLGVGGFLLLGGTVASPLIYTLF